MALGRTLPSQELRLTPAFLFGAPRAPCPRGSPERQWVPPQAWLRGALRRAPVCAGAHLAPFAQGPRRAAGGRSPPGPQRVGSSRSVPHLGVTSPLLLRWCCQPGGLGGSGKPPPPTLSLRVPRGGSCHRCRGRRAVRTALAGRKRAEGPGERRRGRGQGPPEQQTPLSCRAARGRCAARAQPLGLGTPRKSAAPLLRRGTWGLRPHERE